MMTHLKTITEGQGLHKLLQARVVYMLLPQTGPKTANWEICRGLSRQASSCMHS
jgi:hypothetical protein